MGYEHRALKAECGHCKRQVAWSWKSWKPPEPPDNWRCECGFRNYLKPPPKWPELPPTLYVGHELHKRMRLHPTPPEFSWPRPWAQPYSIRSFIHQASRELGGCDYTCQLRGFVMGEVVLSDLCCPPEQVHDELPDVSECHMTCGWTNGQITCPLWWRIAKLCQTVPEQRFLHKYLGFVKDRHFPMILPQAAIDIAERRRPDFVAFVPLQYWHYKWVAIQLDASHTEEQAADDARRDAHIFEQNYEVVSLRPNNTGYLEAVRRLVERFDALMKQADDDDVSSWAVEAVVARTEEDPDLPF